MKAYVGDGNHHSFIIAPYAAVVHVFQEYSERLRDNGNISIVQVDTAIAGMNITAFDYIHKFRRFSFVILFGGDAQYEGVFIHIRKRACFYSLGQKSAPLGGTDEI